MSRIKSSTSRSKSRFTHDAIVTWLLSALATLAALRIIASEAINVAIDILTKLATFGHS